MIKSLVVGVMAGLAVGYLMHSSQGMFGDGLLITPVTALDVNLYWSWTAFLVVTLIGWLIDRAIRT